jgi:8-oxo-dGTP diphosphatase
VTPRHSVSVTGIVVSPDGKILVIKRRDDGRWVPPGGVLELEETPQEGLAREVCEETGYQVTAERLTGVYKNMKLGVVSLAFRCHLTGGQARATDEAAAVRWMTLDEIQQHVPEARAIRILDAMNAGEPAVRAHDGERVTG